MKKFQFKSLTMRIWATFTVIMLIMVLGISLIYTVVYRQIEETSKIQDLKVTHDIMVKNNTYNISNRFNELRNLKGIDSFVVNIDANNKKTIVGKNKLIPVVPTKEEIQPPPMTNANSIDVKTWMSSYITQKSINGKQYKETYGNMKFLFVISSITNAENASGSSYLITYVPIMQDNGFLYAVIVIGFIFIALGFITAKLVANRISKPLKELEEYTLRIAHKDWKDPIEVKSEDEIGRLANSMNFMQEELKHADKEEKMFLQSISHDLKTPVMVIMSHAEAIVEGVYVESMEKNAEIIRDEAIRLEKKINHLLYLNTLNYVLENNSDNSEVNLKKLLNHIINRFEAVNSKIHWSLEIQEVYTFGNLDKIQVSIENIFDNGLRYAEKDMKVSLKKEGSFAVIEVFNDGPNIKAEHVDRIFDNFYKDKTGNFGLGLAISKKIIDFYKGQILAVNRDNGVSFIIKYPICE